MLSVYLQAIGILAPGMADWNEACDVLIHPDKYSPIPVAKKLQTILPANESRRATRVTQLALHAAQQAMTQASHSHCLQIFSCSNGDLSTFHQISQALAMAGRPVSPIRFHNSVHNAPAGYWSIATRSQTASTSITAYSDSFSAGLLEAAVQLNASDNTQNRDCVLVCYDEIPPVPFQAQMPITEEFSCALRLSQNAENALCKMDISIGNGTRSLTQLSSPGLEQLRQANPQAIILPLLDAIAHQRQGEITLAYFEQGLDVQLTSIV